jgi:hypothetical protein
MISIKYENGEIKVTVDNLQSIYSNEELPLKLEIVKTVSQNIMWSCDLNNFSWGTYPNPEMFDVVIRNRKGRQIHRYNWDVIQNGSFHYKILWLYCQNLILKGVRPKGLAIGTHDGEFGEWVPLALTNKSDILLVDGSEKQFNELVKNYQNKEGLKFLNTIVTQTGGEVEFFEGGKGYTNTVVERVIRAWETEEIHSTRRQSISINNLIEMAYNGKFDWLHLDVEGLDAKLIMSINEIYLPNLIIFEDNNLFQNEKDEIYNWLKSKNYSLHSESGICSASKIY